MKRPPIAIDLAGPSGDLERWTIRFARLPRGVWGHTDWVRHIVTINYRLRNPISISMTLLHEITHVTCGQNASEQLAINLEVNYQKSVNKLRNAGSLV